MVGRGRSPHPDSIVKDGQLYRNPQEIFETFNVSFIGQVPLLLGSRRPTPVYKHFSNSNDSNSCFFPTTYQDEIKRC